MDGGALGFDPDARQLRLNAIRVVGLKATRPSLLSNIVAAHLSNDELVSLRTLLHRTNSLSQALAKLDIFTHVDALVESSDHVLASPDQVDIVLGVREAPRYFLRTSTDIGDGEGSATATAKARNVLGGGELFEGNVTFGTRTKSAFQLRLDTPVNGSPDTRAELAVFSIDRDLSYFASCMQHDKGVHATLRTLSRLGQHELQWEGVLRRISDLKPSASMSVRDVAGYNVKSAVSHTFVRDTRDDPALPHRGSYFRSRQELAGLGGDVSFLKFENESSVARALRGDSLLISGSLRYGFLMPLNGQRSHLLDRFHLGGPTSVRMFRPNAMGPKDYGDYIGADVQWSAGLSALAPFYHRGHWPVKWQLFANMGKLTDVRGGSGVRGELMGILRQPSISAGFGLVYRTGLLRVEANIGVPLAMGAQESAIKGLQLGIGMSFL